MTDLGTCTVGENIDRIGLVHVVISELEYVVRSPSIIVRVKNAGEEAVSVHTVVVA